MIMEEKGINLLYLLILVLKTCILNELITAKVTDIVVGLLFVFTRFLLSEPV